MAASTDNDRDDGAPIADINVTPFVDVVLVLLVIFMVTAPVLLKDSFGLKLPKATAAGEKVPAALGVAVTRQGQLLLDGQTVTDEAFRAAARDAVSRDPEARAIVSADTEARHGDVVRAIDLLKQAGVDRFAVQIDTARVDTSPIDHEP